MVDRDQNMKSANQYVSGHLEVLPTFAGGRIYSQPKKIYQQAHPEN